VHTYNSWVTEEALAENDKAWQKKLDVEIDKHLDYVAALEVARAKAVAEGAANAKAKEDKHRLEIAKLTEAFNARKRSDVNVSVLNSAASHSCGTSEAANKYAAQLGRNYKQCELDLGRAIEIARDSNKRAREASITVEALK
jgi:hypothetical protein